MEEPRDLYKEVCEERGTRLPKEWKVLPHGKLTQLDDNLLTVVGELHVPMMLPRRMTVVRLTDSRLVIYSAIALNAKEMAVLEAFGHPAFLLVPSDRHRLDAKAWKLRYPSIQVIAPEGSRAGVQKKVPVDTVAPAFGDEHVQFFTVPGTGEKEAALLVHSSNGTTLVLNDLVGNIRNESGFGGWLLRKAGLAGDQPQIPKVVMMTLIKDPDALRAQLLQWSEIETLKRILVSHGSRIAENPREVLRELARSLEATIAKRRVVGATP
jgi:hypothetical protein